MRKNMKNPVDVIKALENTTSRTEKETIIQHAWDDQILEFFEGSIIAYDSMRTFGIKKVPLITDIDDETGNLSWNDFKKLIEKLENRSLTGNDARDALRIAADNSQVLVWNYWYRRIILKDLKCGITEGTINKVLLKNGTSAKKYIIPVFSCQLAKNGEDYPAKISGKKYLDIKLDGVRLISILDKEKNTVIQYSRDGKQNDNFPLIVSSLVKLLPLIKESMVFDGEVVSKSFQDLMTQLNRKENVNTSDAKLALFDCLPLKDFMAGECFLTQSERHNALVEFTDILQKYSNNTIYIIPKLLVDLDTEQGQTNYKEFNREAIEAGYEGIMIKNPSSTYKTKRTDSWLKLKPFITVDLTIVDIEPGKPDSKYSHTTGGIVCSGTDQGKNISVTVGSGLSEELRDQIWKNKEEVKGRIVEIKGDALTKSQDNDTWSLRFPVFMKFRGWQPDQKI
jgi:DNA ligase-1